MRRRNGNRNEFLPSPIPHERALKKALARLRRMSADEIFEISVHAGIHKPDGSLTRPYLDTSNTPHR